MYHKRTHANRHRASPVFCDGKLYLTSRDGFTSVVKSGREFELLESNNIEEDISASPVFADGRIYLRSYRALWPLERNNLLSCLDIEDENYPMRHVVAVEIPVSRSLLSGGCVFVFCRGVHPCFRLRNKLGRKGHHNPKERQNREPRISTFSLLRRILNTGPFARMGEINPETLSPANEWVRTPVDAFILRKLTEKGLTPSPPAEPQVWLRRVYLDVIGLPPTREQVEAFLKETGFEARQRVVDQLLNDPGYGIRWGRKWLDVVRYADTNGYERDGDKPHVWRYRDYVINSLNQDKPFDQFLTEQLAGDEVEHATAEAMIGTAYLRLGAWDDEACRSDDRPLRPVGRYHQGRIGKFHGSDPELCAVPQSQVRASVADGLRGVRHSSIPWNVRRTVGPISTCRWISGRIRDIQRSPGTLRVGSQGS